MTEIQTWAKNNNKKVTLARNPFLFTFTLQCRQWGGSVGGSLGRESRAPGDKIRWDKPCDNTEGELGSCIPCPRSTQIFNSFQKTSSGGNRAGEGFMNSSCPSREIRKCCPRGMQHSAFEAALILGFGHLKGLNHKNFLGGSLALLPWERGETHCSELAPVLAAWPRD